MSRRSEADYVYQRTKRLRLLLGTGIVCFSFVVPGITCLLWVRRAISLLVMSIIVSNSWAIALTATAAHYTGFWKAFLKRRVGCAFVTEPAYTYAYRYKKPPLRERDVLLMYQRRHPFKNQWIFPAAVFRVKDRDLRHTVARVVQRVAGVPAVAEEIVYSYTALGSPDSAFSFEVNIYATVLGTEPEELEDCTWVGIADIINSPDPTGPKTAPRFVRILRELVDEDEEERRLARPR